MKKYLLLVSALFLIGIAATAQNMEWGWARAVASPANESFKKIATDSRNGIYAFGTFDGPSLMVGSSVLTNLGSTDLLLIKYDSLGNVVWAKSFGSTGSEGANDIETDLSGNIIITGYFSNTMNMGPFVLTSTGATDAFIAKINGSGNVTWARSFTGNQDDAGDAITTDRENNIYVAGRYNSTNFQFIDTLLTNVNPINGFYGKLDSNGNRLWARKIIGNSQLLGFSITDIEYYKNSERVIFFGSFAGGILNFTSNFISIGIPSISGVQQMFKVVIDSSGGFLTQDPLGFRTSGGGSFLDRNDNFYYSGSTNQLSLINPRPFVSSPLGTNQGVLLNTQSSSGANDMLKLNEKLYILGLNNRNVSYNNGFTLQSAYACSYIWETDSTALTTKYLLNTPFTSSGVSFKSLCADTAAGVLYSAGGGGGSAGQLFSLSNNPNTQISFGGANDAIISKVYVNRQLPFQLGNVENINITFCQNSQTAIGSPRGASGGTQPYTYSWTPATGLENPNAPYTLLVNPPANAAYVLTATDAAGNTASTDMVHVNVLPAVPAPTVTASGPLALCPGQSVTLTSTPAYRYRWNTNNPGDTLQSITVSTPQSYVVIAIDTNGCRSPQSNVMTVTYTINQPTIRIGGGGGSSICQGDSLWLICSDAFTYLWSNGATTRQIWVRTPGDYWVVTTNFAGCSSIPSDTLTVIVNPLPPTPTVTASGPLSFCQGGSVQLISSAANGYLWSNGASTQSITVTTAGNYSVVTNNGGCSSAPSNPVTVTVGTATPVITASGPLSFCQGGSVQLTSTAAGGYLWSNGATTQSITVITAGNYSVIINNGSCSSAPSNPVTVTVNPLPATPTITASGPLSFCEGGSVQLTSTAAGGYLWSNGATTQSITVTTAGNYSVITNNGSCSSAPSNPVTVTVTPLPATPTITASGPLTFCEGGSVQLTSTAANGYLWSDGATTQSITATTAGNYSVVVTNSAGCSSVASNILPITVNPNPPVPTITQTGNTLSSSAATGNQWYFNGSIITGATNQTYNYVTPGQYSVTVTDANGCSSSSLPHTGNFVNGTITILSNGEEFMHRIAPNPVNNQASINYHLQSAADISIQIIAINGSRTLSLLPAQRQPAGYYRMEISRQLAALRPGMYIVQYLVNGQSVTEKFIVNR